MVGELLGMPAFILLGGAVACLYGAIATYKFAGLGVAKTWGRRLRAAMCRAKGFRVYLAPPKYLLLRALFPLSSGVTPLQVCTGIVHDL